MSEWIRVDDQLPEIGVPVLVLVKAGYILTGGRDFATKERKKSDWFLGHQLLDWDWWWNFNAGIVTHWVLPPGPPK